MDPVSMMLMSAAIGGGSSLIGGLLGQQSQQQQIQFAQQQASGAFLPQYAANMRAAGFNPYGGGMSPPSVSIPGGSPMGEAIAQAGGTFGKAIAGMTPPESKTDLLQQQLLAGQVEHQDLVNSQMKVSLASRVQGAADRPFFGGSGGGIPLPVSDPRPNKGYPDLFTDYRDRDSGAIVQLLSPDAQRSVFSGVPTAPLYPAIAATLAGRNALNAGRAIRDMRGPDDYVPSWLQRVFSDPVYSVYND